MVTVLPSRSKRQRKPSHLGSYCHSLPVGMSATERASIGSRFLGTGVLVGGQDDLTHWMALFDCGQGLGGLI